MSEPCWPVVPEHIASFLSRNFVHVRHLDAAFDSVEECEDLIINCLRVSRDGG